MEPFKERLVNEYTELAERHDKLMAFTNGNEKYKELDYANQVLLMQQSAWMLGYKNTLLQRIALLFDKDEITEYHSPAITTVDAEQYSCGYKAVEIGLIDAVGGLSDALEALREEIRARKPRISQGCER